MFSLIHLALTAVLVAAGVVAFRLWKNHQAVTGAAVVAGTETLIKDAAAQVSPAVEALIAKLVAEAVAKALAPKA